MMSAGAAECRLGTMLRGDPTGGRRGALEGRGDPRARDGRHGAPRATREGEGGGGARERRAARAGSEPRARGDASEAGSGSAGGIVARGTRHVRRASSPGDLSTDPARGQMSTEIDALSDETIRLIVSAWVISSRDDALAPPGASLPPARRPRPGRCSATSSAAKATAARSRAPPPAVRLETPPPPAPARDPIREGNNDRIVAAPRPSLAFRTGAHLPPRPRRAPQASAPGPTAAAGRRASAAPRASAGPSAAECPHVRARRVAVRSPRRGFSTASLFPRPVAASSIAK